MKRSTIFGQIQTFIRNATPKVLKANHATVEESLLASVNMTPVNDSLLIQSNITAIPYSGGALTGTVTFNVWFKRVGNEVIVSGSFKNNTTSSLNPYRLASIKSDSEFLPDDRTDPLTGNPYVFYFDAETSTGEKLRFCIRTVSGVAYIELLVFSNPSSSLVYQIKNCRYDAKD